MYLPSISKTILLSTSLLLLTACGGGGGSTLDVKEIAINNIEAYADNNSRTAPTLEDYSNAGVQGVTADNIDDINALVDGLTAEDVDSTEEIKALVASLGINLVPIANAQSITLNEDTSKALTLTASDADGDSLTYTVVANPTHGTLSGTAPNMTYTPTANYFGSDSFTFKVNDGTVDSAVQTVSISVSDVAEPNVAPVANAQSITLNEDTSKALTLTASDADGDSLTYTVVANPTHGTLSGTAPNMTYTPTANYFGSDSFTFKVNDGTVDSAVQTVSISVSDVAEPNVAPVANEQTLTFEEDSIANAITLTASDADDDELTYTIVSQPSHGTLGGTAPDLTYTPTADYFGDDSFTFKVNDGTVDSETVMVGITVTDVAETAIQGIKKTGQTKSYNEAGDEVADGSIKDDGFYQKGVEPSYTRDDEKQIVEDQITGLMWQDDAEAKTITKPWVTQENYDARNYSDTTGDTATTYCSNLTLGNYTDWRLPTVVELQSIVVEGKSSPTIDTTAFVNYTTSYFYWSSTTDASRTYLAWGVYFYFGYTAHLGKSNNNYVRCVRAGQ